MRCACCNKKKGLFESFEELDKENSICVECSKLLYKYQDAKKEKKDEEANEFLKKIKSKKNSPEFLKWLEGFLKRFEPKEEKSSTDGESIKDEKK